MANQFTSSTLSGNYNDDYNETDNYHQILFNSGRALQARELTQLQTILHNELARLGKNVFKEGAIVSSGGHAVNADYEWIKVSATNAGGAFADIPVGTVFKNPLTNVEARVLEVKARDGSDFILNTLYVQYISSGSATIGATTTRFGDGETLYDQSGGGYQLVTETPSATGQGVKFTVGEGDFFVLGHFVHTVEQSIILSPYSSIANATVGFKVVQDVVTVNDTTSLYDNANGIVNNASPGADRYRISLQLTTQDKLTDADTFVFLATVENSTIVEEIEESDAYNKIEEMIAMRTHEESGNYIVNPFVVNVQDAVAGDSSLELIVSPGLAYINGYRVDKSSTTKLLIPRPQQTETVVNDVVPVTYGNYFIADSNRGLPDLDASQVNLYNDFAAAGTAIGTARIRAVEKDGVNNRVYVFDVNVDSDKSLRDAKSVGTGVTDHFNLVREAAGAKLHGVIDNDLLFPTSRPRPESFSDITLTKQIREDNLVAGGGLITLPTLPVGQAYTDTSLWIVSTNSETAIAHTVATPTNSGRDVQISGLVNAATYEVLSYVQKTATRKAKTLTSAIATLAKQYDSVNSVSYYEFTVPDIYEVDSARSGTSSGINMLPGLLLDDGQRDNYYAKGRLIINAADSAPPSLYVNYRYFARSAGGDFYDATSYGNVPVAYRDIPNHTLKDGTLVNLRNYVDFRPDETSFGTASDIFDLPRNGTNITADINYYLPRADKLLLTQEGEVQLLLGQQASNPQYKATPDNALELYKILLNANTLDENDLQSTPIEHKHYTMSDIAKIEAKLDDLEEYTTLNILELEQKLNAALDSDGNERAESGSQVDDFGDQTGGDTNNDDYSASMDPESKLIRPMTDEDNIRLVVDATLSSNIVKKGDNVYVAYDTEQWAYQSLASRSLKVNPFGLVDNVGVIKLSPTSDEWKDSKEEAEKAIAGSNRLDKKQAFLWNNWMWNWFGRSPEDVDLSKANQFNSRNVRGRVAYELREQYASTYTSLPRYGSGGRFVSRVVPSDTLREVVGKRIIDLALIPWIRSRKIYFHAKGLRPNTKFTPFFDGDKVTEWCREEAAFLQYSDRTDDNGNQDTHQAITAHPSGSSDLISDENGEIIGSFFIPNIRPSYNVNRVNAPRKMKLAGQRFRSGIREFKLLDIDTNDWAAAGSKAFAHYVARGALWNHWGNIITTRPSQYWSPHAHLNNKPQAFSSKELQNALNQIRSADVNLVDPKLAGKYGTGSAALSVAALNGLDTTGQMSQVLSDYVDVDQNQFGSNIVSTMTAPLNPLAQTFYVDNQFGVVLTNINLYFRTKDTGNLPVSIHLRPMVNGRPSSNEIVPDSHVFLNPSEVTAVGTDPTLTVIQQAPTVFSFDEPIYLKPWTHYAVVVTSQSTEYEVFSAKTQEPVFGSTTKIVTTQPAPGSLFLPQNGMFWIETKDQDLMYKINRAKFDLGGGSLILKNARLPDKLLSSNPIQTYSGTRKIYVNHKCHGLEPGDTAFIDSAEDIAGIDANSWLNAAHTVDSVDVGGYTFTYDGSQAVATSSSIGGGDRVLSRRNVVFNVLNPYVESIIPNNTSLDVSAKFTEGKNISSTRINAAGRWSQDDEYSRITLKQNVDFQTPKGIYNYSAQETNLGAGVASTYVKVDMKTANDYVSPVIDLQRSSLVLVGYCQDNPDVTPHINAVDETQPTGGTTGSKHITSPVILELDAVGIETKALVNIPDGADVVMYYRTATTDENIYDKHWIQQPTVNTIPSDNSNSFRDVTWLPGDQGGTLNPFNQVQTKFVLKGTDLPATIRNLRFRYLAV